MKTLKLNYDLINELEITVAKNIIDLYESHQFCYNTYIEEGYAKPFEGKIRLTPHHALPTTTTIIARHHGRVVGTITAILDGPLGLPSDKFSNLEELREKHTRIVEGSSFAVDKDYRGKDGQLTFLLIKYFYKYAKQYMNADCIVAAINPKQKSLYNDVLLFDDYNTELSFATSANQAPAIIVMLDLNGYKKKYYDEYAVHQTSGHGSEVNLYDFFISCNFQSLRYPQKSIVTTGNPIMTPEYLETLFARIWDMKGNIDKETFCKLRDIYSDSSYDHFFEQAGNHINCKSNRQQRFTTNSKITKINNISLLKKVSIDNISENGLAVKRENNLVSCSNILNVEIEIYNTTVSLQLVSVWRNEKAVGFRILSASDTWVEAINYAGAEWTGQITKTAQKIAA